MTTLERDPDRNVNGNRKLHTFEKSVGTGLTLFGWYRSGVRGWTGGA